MLYWSVGDLPLFSVFTLQQSPSISQPNTHSYPYRSEFSKHTVWISWNQGLVISTSFSYRTENASCKVCFFVCQFALFYFMLSFSSRSSQLGTFSVDQVGPKLRDPPASASQVLRSKVCVNTTWTPVVEFDPTSLQVY